MSYFVGQLVTVSTEVRTAAGVLTDATVILNVTSPDGVTTTYAPPDHPGTGLYSKGITATQAGDWFYQFTSSGTVIATDAGQFHVRVAAPMIVGLTEVKKHANITTNVDDEELMDFIGTAQNIIEHLVGPVVGQQFVEQHTARGNRIVLLRRPVRSITSVVERNGSSVMATLTPSEYVVDTDTGMLERTSASGVAWRYLGDNVVVTYVAGRSPVPDAIRTAAKDLATHLYRRSQVLRGARRPGAPADEQTQTIMGYSVPRAVVETLAPYRLGPRII